MKKRFMFILLLMLSVSVFGQKSGVLNSKEKALTEQYKNEYKKKNYKKFAGKITVKDNLVMFDDKIIYYDKSDNQTKILLQEGIIYPQLLTDYQMDKFLTDTTDKMQRKFFKLQKDPRASFDVSNMTINDTHYLSFLSSDPKVKVFNLICKDGRSPGTTTYLIELTNKNAAAGTSVEDFIRNSKLTFILKNH
ncbi:hypothetical protein LF887_12880 [Chryseobacterium sp. MEBOG06]|uniref:hypothetical protein n=1 Tax=Chryseobacterium sp. MEBOG06 TaxID=2879938 RepID=UPI001F46868B|nr:hypothetical protein [Chryseobacterium sp. MEBOG06]UKB81907.1 hypothetical protein LF887_12880 [Chryseobacterium sp. MEBOG06]